MILRFFIFLSIPLSFLISSCSPQKSEIVVAEYGDKEILMNEFEEAYAKNAGGYEEAKDDSLSKLKNFLDLYVNFKMKLRDAQVRGYEKDKALQEELTDYKKKVGVTYLLEKQLIEPGVRDLYEKRKTELRVSHLMIRPDSAGMEAAKSFAQSLLDSILIHGADYEQLAMQYSQDQFSRPLGGDIFYVTGGLLPYEFEEAMYDAEAGKVYPKVVETQYGFHLIKITDKRDRIPQVRASHILIDWTNDGEIDSAYAKAKVDSVMAEIKAGGNFAELAEKYSEDPSGKQQGGDLGYFERRQMVKEFDEVVFNLEVDEVSEIVTTQFGYHIIKLTDKKDYPSYDEEKENLKKLFKQNRYQQEYDSLIDSLKKTYSYSLDENNLNKLASELDSLRIGSDIPELQDPSAPIYSFGNMVINTEQFVTKVNAHQEFINRLVSPDIFSQAAAKLSAEDVLELAALDLENNNKEFAGLMEDYKNGIYIFKLQEDEVWKKVEIDSVKLLQHYEKTKQNYVWPDRVTFQEIFVKSDSLANHLYTLLKEGESFDTLASNYTERPGYKEKAGMFSLQDAKQTQLAVEADKLNQPGDISEPFKNSGGYSIVKLVEKDPSRVKTFEEAKAEVSGSFQEAESKKLEQAYLENLKQRYEPELHYDELENAFKP